MTQWRREVSVAFAIGALAVVLAVTAPAYFSRENLVDLFLANMPALVVGVGMTLVMLSGEIDISVGSLFAICSVAAGVSAKFGWPIPLVVATTCAFGAVMGAMNGALVAYLHVPSIVATLAAMVALRDALRWATEGAWVQDLPAEFQWLGFSQSAYPIFVASVLAACVVLIGWGLGNLSAGRAIYATGSNPDAARLAGFDVALVKFSVFAMSGMLTGFAALLNSVRFNQIPSNAGLGLEMKVIAAVVVGGTAVRGGRGSVTGTVLGIALLGAIGPALTFLGASAYWERALQGAIILVGVAIDALRDRAPVASASIRTAPSV